MNYLPTSINKFMLLRIEKSELSINNQHNIVGVDIQESGGRYSLIFQFDPQQYEGVMWGLYILTNNKSFLSLSHSLQRIDTEYRLMMAESDL